MADHRGSNVGRIVGSLVIIFVLYRMCGSSGTGSAPERSVAATARPTAVPSARPASTPTPLQPVTGPSAEELRRRWDELTVAQRAQYEREIAGTYVQWPAQILEVHTGGTVYATTIVGLKPLVMMFTIPVEQATLYDRHQKVIVEGTIVRIEEPTGGQGFLESLLMDLTLGAHLAEASISPARSDHAPAPTVVSRP